MRLRTQRWENYQTELTRFIGSRDPFGTIAEMKGALELIPGSHQLMEAEGAGHDLLGKKGASELPARIANEFLTFLPARNLTAGREARRIVLHVEMCFYED